MEFKDDYMGLYECDNSTYSLTFKISVILYIVITLFSLANSYAYTSVGATPVTLLSYLPMFCILKYVLDNNIFSKKIQYRTYIFWLIPFLFLYFLCFEVIAVRSPYFRQVVGMKLNLHTLSMIKLIPVLFISWYMLQIKDIKFNKLLTIIIISLFTVNFLLTFKALIDDPLLSRHIAAGLADEEDYLKGVAGFDITHSVVLLVPCIMFLIAQSSRLKRILFIAFFIAAIIYIYMCAYTIAILAVLLIVSMYLFISSNSITKILLVFLVCIICVLAIDRTIILDIINALIDKVEIDPVQTRLRVFVYLLFHGDTSSDSLARLGLYMRSLDGFIESPLLGIYVLDSKYQLSGHSTALDILGGCGLFGFVPFCIYMYYSYKYSLQYVKHDMYRKCISSTYIAFIFIATLNPQLTSPNVLLTLLVINPIICSITDTS
jgi:hypothetical protein